jgi:hypothetical protein
VGAEGTASCALALRRLRFDVSMAKSKLALEHKKLKLKEREVESKIKAVDHIVSQANDISFRSLSNQELDRYTVLYNKLKSDGGLPAVEAEEFSRLMSKTCNPTAINGNGVAALNGLSHVDNMFHDDDGEDE